MLHHVPQTIEMMLLSGANPSDLKSSKKHLAYNEISRLQYLGRNLFIYGWLHLFDGFHLFQIRPDSFWSVLITKKLQHLDLYNIFVKINFNCCFFLCFLLPPVNCYHEFPHYQIPVHHQLFLQHPCSSHIWLIFLWKMS